MAKYGKSASKNVASAMRRRKRGTLKSGSGRTVTSRKQAIAIGLSEAREKGAKVPSRKRSRKSAKSSRTSSARTVAKKRWRTSAAARRAVTDRTDRAGTSGARRAAP